MKKHKLKRSTVLDITLDRREYHILRCIDSDPYWDEGIKFYPKWRRGFKNPNKRIMNYQRRMYRTWKHNRKTQWKE